MTESPLEIARAAVAQLRAWSPPEDEMHVVLESADVILIDQGDADCFGIEVRWRQNEAHFSLLMSVTELLERRLGAGDPEADPVDWFMPDVLLALVEPHGNERNVDRTVFRTYP